MQLHQLGSRAAEFEERGAILLAISPQQHQKNEAFARKRGVSFPILWDEGRKTIAAWGLSHELDPHQEYIPYPTTYVIGKGSKILWRKLGESDSDRPKVEDVLAAIPS